MNAISKILIAIILCLSFIVCHSQINNSKTETVKIYGNCSMCKSTIEKAGNLKKNASVSWNKDTKMAVLIYDEKKTNPNEILKRIALAGYDSEYFLTTDAAYAKLEDCCQYQRKAKHSQNSTIQKTDSSKLNTHNSVSMPESKLSESQLKLVFDLYFTLKDALVKTDGNTASAQAKDLLTAINNVKMEKLATDEHIIWMKAAKDLAFDAGHIAETNDVSHQRDHFTSLSKNMYALMKVSKQATAIYFQHCPMYNNGKGADWLSKETAIKNPYYGSQMLSCGKTVETIK